MAHIIIGTLAAIGIFFLLCCIVGQSRDDEQDMDI